MIDSYKKSVIGQLCTKYDLRPTKKYGQNFIADKNIIDKIVAAAELSGDDTIVEIGPGIGALTVPLSRVAGKVIAVEIDAFLIPVLEEVLGETNNVEIVNSDFMKFDLSALPKNYKLIGNLPYYITTPIIAKVLESGFVPSLSVFMMQREVAERIASPPGSKKYGSISVLVQYHCSVALVAEVSREVFVPKPDVSSSVLAIRPVKREKPEGFSEEVFFSLVRAGFNQRRKTLRNSLSVLGYGDAVLKAAFEKAEIDPGLRAETLSVEDFIGLAVAFGTNGSEKIGTVSNI